MSLLPYTDTVTNYCHFATLHFLLMFGGDKCLEIVYIQLTKYKE